MFIKAFEISEIAKFNEEQKFAYEESMKYYRDLKNVIDTSEELGFEKGLMKGEIIGIEKGKLEGKEKRDIEIVTNMYYKGITIENISLFTNIELEKIKEILNID